MAHTTPETAHTRIETNKKISMVITSIYELTARWGFLIEVYCSH